MTPENAVVPIASFAAFAIVTVAAFVKSIWNDDAGFAVRLSAELNVHAPLAVGEPATVPLSVGLERVLFERVSVEFDVTTAPADPMAIARAVATFVPSPLMPVDTGNPVQLESVPEDGVPRAPLANSSAPDPLSSVIAVRRLALDGVARNVAIPVAKPLIPVETGNPVALDSVAEDGVPSAPLNTTGAPAEPTFTASAVAMPVPSPEMPVDTGSPVQLDSVPAAGVPSAPPVKYREPEPASSLTSVRKFALDGVAAKASKPEARVTAAQDVPLAVNG